MLKRKPKKKKKQKRKPESPSHRSPESVKQQRSPVDKMVRSVDYETKG